MARNGARPVACPREARLRRALAPVLPPRTARTLSDNSRDLFEALSLLTPSDIDRPKARYGSRHDGGYVFAEPIRPGQPVLSLGIGPNCDFELEMAQRGHHVAMFDPTITAPPHAHPLFSFHPIGIGAEASPDGDYLTLDALVTLAGFGGRDDIVFKIDVEGAEYASLATAPDATLRRFEQLSIELHDMGRLAEDGFRSRFLAMMKMLTRYFTIFHVHANNCTPVSVIGGSRRITEHHNGGFPVAETLELSLIRTDLVRARPSRTFYPTAFDRPNHPHFPDHILCFYPFLPTIAAAAETLANICEINDLRRRVADLELDLAGRG